VELAVLREGAYEVEEDPRWSLVQRILSTSTFLRSPRLSEFLHYVSRETLEGRGRSLTEQRIGETVFGRPSDYDSSIDSIVRSHALRLRQRLEQFFAREGRDEPIHLSIPRGSYIVVFERAPTKIPEVTDSPRPANVSQSFILSEALSEIATDNDIQVQDNVTALANVTPQTAPQNLGLADSQSGSPKRTFTAQVVLSLVLLAILCLSITGSDRAVHADRHHPLWSRLFTADRPTRIVLADSGLVLFHAIDRRYFSLDDYLAKRYKPRLTGIQHVDPDFAVFLTTRRYTSMVDASTLVRLTHLPEATPDRTLVEYPRDMRLDEFKSGNLILMGAQEADPWVELFERSMNFVFTTDTPGNHNAFRNNHPQPGEPSLYGPGISGSDKTIYAVIAFLPNLSETGDVLLLEGINMAGTESAADLIMDDSRLLPLLAKVRRPDGSLPHFEMMLECSTLTDSATPARVVALHSYPN